MTCSTSSKSQAMPLKLEPPPSSLGHQSPPKHQCSSSSPCTILLLEIGKYYHAFPKGSFRSHFTPPAIPKSVLHHFDAHLFYWSWTMKASPNAGKSFAIPIVPTSCLKDSPKAIQWVVSIFHAFKSQLSPRHLTRRQAGSSLPMSSYIRTICISTFVPSMLALRWANPPHFCPPSHHPQACCNYPPSTPKCHCRAPCGDCSLQGGSEQWGQMVVQRGCCYGVFPHP